MEISETKKQNRFVPLITYCVAVICLILGLFIPIFNGKNVLAFQLPDALNCALSKNIISTDKTFDLNFPIDLFGLGKIQFDLMAWVVLLYAVVTVISLIALAPVIICTVKDKPNISRVFAYVVEIAAVLVLSLYVVLALELYTISHVVMPLLEPYPTVEISYNMIIALGGSLLALVVLSILSKKGNGVLKTVLFLLSAVSVVALFNIGALISSLAGKTSFIGDDGVGGYGGIGYLEVLFQSDYSQHLSQLTETKVKAATVLATILGLAVIINYIIEVLSLSTNGKKLGIKFNIARYGVEVAAAAALLITVAVCKYSIGIMLIVIAAVAVIALAINVIRLLVAIKRAKAEEFDREFTPSVHGKETMFVPAVRKEVQPEPEPVKAEPVLMEQPALLEKLEPIPTVSEVVNSQPAAEHRAEPEYNVQPRRTQPRRVQEVKPVQPVREYRPEIPVVQSSRPVQTTSEPPVETRIYTINTIYGGPTDDFIKKLSNDEKIEFARTFIEKSKGEIGNIPDYVIGGNNKTFFSSVFIYLGRIRGMISDSLLNKMYKELNMM